MAMVYPIPRSLSVGFPPESLRHCQANQFLHLTKALQDYSLQCSDMVKRIESEGHARVIEASQARPR